MIEEPQKKKKGPLKLYVILYLCDMFLYPYRVSRKSTKKMLGIGKWRKLDSIDKSDTDKKEVVVTVFLYFKKLCSASKVGNWIAFNDCY